MDRKGTTSKARPTVSPAPSSFFTTTVRGDFAVDSQRTSQFEFRLVTSAYLPAAASASLGSDRRSSESRFSVYVEALSAALRHADRAAPFRAYCTGLLLPGPRKSVEPMAARVEPAWVGAAQQSLHHFVANAEWSDQALLGAVRERVLPGIERHCSAT